MITDIPHCRVEKLPAPDRPKAIYRYVVSGFGTFPFDMLRYDAAWPADQESTFHMERPPGATGNSQRSVKLTSYRPPTPGRWNSFGWQVKFSL